MCPFIPAFSMACGSLPWPWGFRLPPRFCRRALQYGSYQWKFFGMSERKEWAGNNHILSPFGARFAPIPCERQVGKTQAHPSTLVVTIARRKSLIKKRLQVFQFDAKLPSFRQADRKSTRLNSSHLVISYAVFCLKKK